ncbi:hypothetical protein [Wenjunlia tyrosinilytica]|uniref:Membrane protein n=1 Tax=Wenjunlia tyrosinilytica TaxID=1544741 RepID=A0A918DW30_9ACTN|nr:hypothetical protein [Wenjunlia tyrosinilytica]GGO86980.1 membrane protein [Wenjunlia tyrosinilytica]
MGIESEQLIYDYLSRVGDLAQSALPAAERLRLVTQLRQDIERERERSAGQADNPAAVRRILGKLGSPDTVVERAAAWGDTPQDDPDAPPFPGSEVLVDPAEVAVAAEWWRLPQQRSGSADSEPADPDPADPGLNVSSLPPGFLPKPTVVSPSKSTFGGVGKTTDVPAQRGFEQKKARKHWWSPLSPADPGPDPGTAVEQAEPQRRRGLLRRRRNAAAFSPARGVFWREWLAAALLLVGTFTGSLFVVAAGWLVAYYSSRLTRMEAQVAALGIPALTATGTFTWLWGRNTGRWGEPLKDGRMGPALQDALPVMVRVAAIGSAVYLVWRADRRARRG